MKTCDANLGDSFFWLVEKIKEIERILSIARNKIAEDLKIVKEDEFAFCWIVDYPMFEKDEKTQKNNF